MVASRRNTPGDQPVAGEQQGPRIMGLGALSSAVVSRSSVGESLNAYTDTFKAILAKQNSAGAESIKIIPVPASASGLVVGAIAVVQTSEQQSSVFTLIIESTLAALPTRVEKVHGRRDIEIPTTAGDVYNDSVTMWAKVAGVVANAMGTEVANLVEAGACVIYSSVKPDNEVSLQAILNRASNATKTVLDPNAPIFSAAAEDFKGTRWTANIDFMANTGRSGAGLPIRRSFTVGLNATINNSQDLAQQSVVPLSQLSGYVDLVYVGPKPIQQGYHTVDSPQIMAPRIVITNTEPLSDNITPELQMMSLATSALMVRNDAWIHTLRPRFSNDGQVDIHSLNGLSVELSDDKQQVVVDVNDPSFNLVQFVREVVHPTPIFTLHVEECGEVTWIMAMMLDAAAGNANAYNYVYAACNNLTNNVFETMFPRGTPIATVEEDRVVLGTWVDKAGKERDLRDWDSLAALNMLGFTDRMKAFEYSGTFNPATGTVNERIEKRVSIIKEILGGQCNVKAYARPVNLNPAFISALFNSLDAVQRIQLETYLENNRPLDRTRAGLLDFGVLPGMVQQHHFGPATAGNVYAGQVRTRNW